MERTTRGEDERKDEDERMTDGQPTANRPAPPAAGADVTRDKGTPPAPDDAAEGEPQDRR
jgi:hypothetical protein